MFKETSSLKLIVLMCENLSSIERLTRLMAGLEQDFGVWIDF